MSGLSEARKDRLFLIYDYLFKYSDDQHPKKLSEISNMLIQNGISVSQKTLYDDLKAIGESYDLISYKGRHAGYFIASRDFETPELKLLVDCVQSSKFITKKKTVSLIKKIEGLTSVYEANKLQREVYVQNRIKSEDESVFIKVDEIFEGIQNNKAIKFQYFEYSIDKKEVLRHNGKYYFVSPYYLLNQNENYYMIAYDNEKKELKNFRVDKMKNISISKSSRVGKEATASIDISSYGSQVFGMFGGTPEKIKIRFANHLVGAALDILGKDIMIIPDGKNSFTVTKDIVISSHFFGWIFALGKDVEILWPEKARTEYLEYLEEIIKKYK